MTVGPVGDAWLALLPTKAGWTIDDTLAEPADVQPDRIYFWPRRTAPQKIAEDPPGRFDEAPLRWSVLVAASAKGENRVLTRTRALTDTLDEWVDAIHRMVREHRGDSEMWWDAYVENINYQAISNDKVRAARVDLVVRLNADHPAVFGGSGVGIGSGL